MTGAATYYERRLGSDAYHASRSRRARLVYALCAERLASADHVVDLGAGTGLVRDELEALSGRSIVGIEIDARFIESPERMAVGDLLALPLADGALDFGLANHVYEHVADLERFFAELARVLAPDGVVYLTAGNRFAPIEPHYRIPTLSWWPRPMAERILRWSGRGESYDDIRFATHRTLVRAAARNALAMDDVTADVLRTQIGRYESPLGRSAGRLAGLLPDTALRPLLVAASPQWFFFVRRRGS